MDQIDLRNKDEEWLVFAETDSCVLVIAGVYELILVRWQQRCLNQVQSTSISDSADTYEHVIEAYYVRESGSRSDEIVI